MTHQQRVEIIFLQAIDLTPPERDDFLRNCCKGDPETILEIESLLAADTDSEMLLESAVQDAAANFFSTQNLIGERLGLYRIVREIGRGGMGSVYLALRDDSEYRKEVAIKIVRRGMDTADVLERFRHERQILANLEHPYIARLFDGGSTSDGVPFFVMEFIEGKPVDVFCRESGLDRGARCALFLRILEAVAYAHRNLVVHRDLKPVNILVSADGTPKLLDFGVAKLLNGDPDRDRTSSLMTRPFTPAYASPEQVLGAPITTATDIYSLGAILYELLVGEPAQPIETHTPAEIERVVCRTGIARPSSKQRGLPSDLDNIILMAMRKEPERRYLSADQFGEDIRRYLEGKPVIARQTSLRYRATKFILRNRMQAVAASLIAASLLAGFGISLRQTHRANLARATADAQRLIAEHQTSLARAANLSESQQRALAEQQRADADRQRMAASEQRDRAEHQKSVAEKRARDMMELSRRTLFDIHDAIALLPGSVAARQSVVKTTLEYLENLEKEAGLDDEMRTTLAAAYYKPALIQGDAQAASLQDYKGAETDLLKAQELILPVYKRTPSDPNLMKRWIEVRSSLADVMYRTERQKESLNVYMALLPLARRLAAIKPCDVTCDSQEMNIEGNIAYKVMSNDPALALEHAKRGIALGHAVLSRHPNEPAVMQFIGSITAAAGGAQMALGDLEQADKSFRESIATREKLLRNDPNNTTLRRNMLIVYGNYTMLLGVPWSPNLGWPDEARLYARKAVALARESAATDPNDATARRDLGMILSRLGMIDPKPDGIAESLHYLEEAQSLLEPIVAGNPKSAETVYFLAMIIRYEGHRHEALGLTEEGIADYRRAMALLQPLLESQFVMATREYIKNEEDLALADVSAGDPVAALDLSNSAFLHAQKYTGENPHLDWQFTTLGQSWSVTAAVEARLGMEDRAQQSAATAMKFWNAIKNQGVLTAYRREITDIQAILRAPHS